MEVKKTSEIENSLFARKEIEVLITSEKTPDNTGALKLLSENYSVDQGRIKIKGIYGGFGHKNFRILANIYSSEKEKEMIEKKSKKEKESEKKQAEVKETKKEAQPENQQEN